MSIEKLALTNYRALIPFHILLDLDLTVSALRMYGLIEQMESAREKVFFNMRYLAEQLGIEVRGTQKIAKLLREKGYIEHFEHKPGKWLWRTKKRPPEEIEDEECITETGGGCPARTGGVSCQDTHTTNIPNTNNQTTTLSSAGFVSEEVVIDKEIDSLLWHETLGKPIRAKDKKEFLQWCKYWMENLCKAPDEPSKLRILMSIIRKGGLSKPKGFGEDMRETPGPCTKDDRYLYEDYLSSINRDINLNLLKPGQKGMGFDEWAKAGKPKRVDLKAS